MSIFYSEQTLIDSSGMMWVTHQQSTYSFNCSNVLSLVGQALVQVFESQIS